MKKRKRNLCVLLLSILVAAAWSAVVLNVSAYFSHQNEKNNVLKTGDNTSHIEEEFEPPDQVTTDTITIAASLAEGKRRSLCLPM